jgi:CheY-like chemotaxis protein
VGRRKAFKVLVVEDSTVNQAVILAMLHRAGHSADVARNGLEAVNAVRDNDYDLVLMDIQMPGMDGVSATREIRALPGGKANVPIIAVTADVVRGSRERFLAAGMNDYIAKPIQMNDLFAAIDRCVGIPC